MPRDPVLLIHGAWQGAWAWDTALPWFRAAGFDCRAADLAGNGAGPIAPEDVTLDDALAGLEAVTADWPAFSVVAHSGGGLLATALAERCMRVKRLAYVAGMMLPSGVSFTDAVEGLAQADRGSGGITPHLTFSHEGRVSHVPAAAACEIFYSDVPEAAAQAAAARLTPQGETLRRVRLADTSRTEALPRLYVEALDDRSLSIALQRRMQALMPGAMVHSLPTGHAPQLSAPEALVAALTPFLRDDGASD